MQNVELLMRTILVVNQFTIYAASIWYNRVQETQKEADHLGH